MSLSWIPGKRGRRRNWPGCRHQLLLPPPSTAGWFETRPPGAGHAGPRGFIFFFLSFFFSFHSVYYYYYVLLLSPSPSFSSSADVSLLLGPLLQRAGIREGASSAKRSPYVRRGRRRRRRECVCVGGWWPRKKKRGREGGDKEKSSREKEGESWKEKLSNSKAIWREAGAARPLQGPDVSRWREKCFDRD